MSFTHTVTKALQSDEGTVTKSNSYTGSSLVAVDETVVTASTNYQITVALDVSAIKSIYINSDQNVTLKTNSGGSPDNTLSLVADVPYEWQTNSYFTNLLTADVTAIFITNASGSTATITLRALLDATP